MEKNIKIVEKCDRKKLNEGRSYGMGFAFLKKISETEYHTVQPLSPCKDYLNDVIAAEVLNENVDACGLKYKPIGLFSTGEVFLGFKILPQHNGAEYTEQKTDTKFLQENYTVVETELNKLEKQLGIKTMSTITKCEDDYFLVKLAPEWISSTFLISLCTLWLRISQYKRKKQIRSLLDTYLTLTPIDLQLWMGAMSKVKKIIDSGKLPVQDFTKYKGRVGSIHSMGINSYV